MELETLQEMRWGVWETLAYLAIYNAILIVIFAIIARYYLSKKGRKH